VLVPADYVRQVSAAGGIPVLLPPVAGDVEVLDRLNALVVAGGADVDPARYGAERSPRTGPAAADRDEAELALLAAAVERDLPVLAVCRGLQLLTVLRGGTLVQHLPDVVGSDVHVPAPGTYGDNPVRVEAGSRLAALVGERMVAGDGGSIINVSSTGAVRPTRDIVPYAAAKAGVNAMTVGLAHAFGPRVRVNAIMPGPFLTTISRAWDMELFEERARTFPARRAGEAEEIVGAALYLASDASSYTTGTILTVDGGAQWSMAGTGEGALR
jgi:NAD(P)-dependent dehydrogenase (short-subunit alcohol dehydrogenase family)